MANSQDMRSTAGTYLRGKNVYGDGGTSPNPAGANQYPKSLQQAARLKRRRRAQGFITEPTVVGSLLTDKGGMYT